MMSEEEKLAFYRSEHSGAAFALFVGFRCTKLLNAWLETKAMIEGRDKSQIIRRLLIKAAEEGAHAQDVLNFISQISLKIHIRYVPTLIRVGINNTIPSPL